MAAIFETLPGIEVPVDGIAKSLADMWVGTPASGGVALAADDARATQVNFVLHLGIQTTPRDATEQFQTAVRFSVRYPSRIVVLCPLSNGEGAAEMRAKIYGECHLGKSKSDKRCVEFVTLSYTRGARPFLENQVSICLSADLPLYYWAHGFSASSKLADYRYLLTTATRVLIDSALAPADAMTYPWPKPEAVRDLVFARLLPLRQSLGQFLSRYPMPSICEGLQGVRLAHHPSLAGEGRVLLAWLRDRVGKCGRQQAKFEMEILPENAPDSFRVAFDFASSKYFRWKASLNSGRSLFEADFGTGSTRLNASASVLAPEMALSEAMFFG